MLAKQTLIDQKSKFLNIWKDMVIKIICNMDETEHYKDTAKHTFQQKGQDCAGARRYNAILTV